MKSTTHEIKPKAKLNLSKIDTGSGKQQLNKNELKLKLSKDLLEISKLQNKLHAENRQSLLIIFQGMDSSGKDEAIKSIMNGVNPQGVFVHSFKHPSELELEHDFLWRHTQELPEHGQITIFNRSHYENVLISKVHPKIVLAERLIGIKTIDKIDEAFWETRYKQIIDFENNLVKSGTQILKFFLHLSKAEQTKRFIDRIEQKEKHWKFSSKDISERSFWEEYQSAYEQAIMRTSTKDAPWYVIPADDKWYARQLIGKIILQRLQKMNPTFPKIEKREKEFMRRAKEKLVKEIQSKVPIKKTK